MTNNIRKSIYNNAILTSLVKGQTKYSLSIVGNMMVFNDINIEDYVRDHRQLINAINVKMVHIECENLLKEGEQWSVLVESFHDVVGVIIHKHIDIYNKYKEGLIDAEDGYHSACVLLGAQEFISVIGGYSFESQSDDSFKRIKHILDINLPSIPEDPYKEIIGDE